MQLKHTSLPHMPHFVAVSLTAPQFGHFSCSCFLRLTLLTSTRLLFGSHQHPQYIVPEKPIIPYPVIMLFSQNQYIVVAPISASLVMNLLPRPFRSGAGRWSPADRPLQIFAGGNF
jgi:hypothetical protein